MNFDMRSNKSDNEILGKSNNGIKVEWYTGNPSTAISDFELSDDELTQEIKRLKTTRF